MPAMRFAILADIHGNLPALEAVVDDLSDLSIVEQHAKKKELEELFSEEFP